MGRYQCHQCDRVFARSFNLRRHKDSGICRGAEVNMLDSDEESDMSERRSLDNGKNIFRKPDLEDVEVDEEEEDETEESEEDEEEEDEEEDDDEEEDNDEDEDDIDDDGEEEEEPQKIKPWDVLMNITTDKMFHRAIIVSGTNKNVENVI